MTTAATSTSQTGVTHVDIAVGGLTCASSAARIEKKLNRLEGVQATVNFATEIATVDFDPAKVGEADLVAAIEATGYSARLPTADALEGRGPEGAEEADAWRQRLLVSAILTLPVVVLAMIPSLQFRFRQWLSLVLAAPVVVCGAWPFHRAAAINAKHRVATMDTLISVGVLAAFTWSLWALLWGGAGEPGMTMQFQLLPSDRHGTEIYLEVAAGVTTLILLGRCFEARAKRRSGSAWRALLELGAKDVAVIRDGREERIPVHQLVVGDRFVVRPGETVATDGVVLEGTSAIDTSMLTGESVPVEVESGGAVAGATVNAGWPPGLARDEGRRRYCVGADHPVSGASANRKGAGAAARRSRLSGVRPDRARVGRGNPHLEGPEILESTRPRRHDRARQDRNRHGWAHEPRGRRAVDRGRPGDSAAHRRRAGAGLGASHRPRDRRGRR